MIMGSNHEKQLYLSSWVDYLTQEEESARCLMLAPVTNREKRDDEI
jgi:hypothetical protein